LSSYDVDGASTTKDGQEKQGIRQIIREEIRQYLQDPLGFPEEYKGWLPEWITQAGIDVPISQVIGFSQFQVQPANNVLTSETTASTSYTDLATVGPSLSGLADGQYLLLYGCFSRNSGADLAVYAPSVNGAAAADVDQGGQEGAAGAYTMRAVTKDLAADGNNSVVLKYKVGGGTGTFLNRWMLALKYANA
jgi:hypothetical protein